MTAAVVGARERWQGFLEQIAQRHALVCRDVESAAREALPASGYDPSPVGGAFLAIDARLIELETRIIDTWNEKVESAYEAEGIPREVQLADRQLGADLAWNLENAREELQHRVYADAARQMFERALATHEDRLCGRCGAALDIPFTYRAINVTCAHCRAIATFEPGMLVRNVLAFGAHALSWRGAQREWLAMRHAERRVKSARSPAPLELLKDYERTQIAYWWKYVSLKATLEPELADVQHEVRSRMEAWYRMSAEHEENWRAAGRPRELS